MFKFVKMTEFSDSAFVRSKLTGAIISKCSERYRHDCEIEFLSSLPTLRLDVMLNGGGDHPCRSRSLTAVRGSAEVAFICSDIQRLRAINARLGA
ncbi:hypothetical protein [Bosea sp. 124]|uniref:DUF7696 family protein n=1 Tax=Bosea sp. 124 TaxID=2135642 RepID=UPI000D3D5DD1|nr:hypothetical protein [Bosea sp. 124]PTM43570.1 hypothetical protein C8D03_5190 [Bosea sp. 124]